jgi:periplasmic copper chaperone A
MNTATLPLSCLRSTVAAWAMVASLGALGADATPGATMAEDVTLKTAWLRPVAAGAAEAKAYVDIVNGGSGNLELVGASTTFAKKVELVQVNIPGDASEGKVVKSMAVPGGKTTRLAYRGSHLRLTDITQDIGNGTVVPLTLAFKTVDGKEVVAKINAQGRGLLLPQQMPAPAKEAVSPPKDAGPEPKQTPAP